MKKLIFSLTAPIIALTTVLSLAELVIRVIINQKLIYNIEMVKYAKELKTADPEGLNSHIHRANASARLMGVEISLNSLGHRGPELRPRDQHTKRVLVLGSSVTMGWGVPQDQVFTSIIESRLNSKKPFGNINFQFENAGIGNYDTLAQWNLLKRQYSLVRPDAVILHYFIGDAEPRGKGHNNFIFKHSYLAAFFYNRIQLALMKAKDIDLYAYYKNIYDDSDAWTKTRGYVSQMNNLATANGAPFIIMIIPDIHNLAPGTPYAEIYAEVEKGFREIGIETINTFGAFQERFGHNEKTLWIQSDDPHPNVKGHQLMAEILYNYFTCNNPLHLTRQIAR